MWRNNIKLAFRNLRKHPGFTGINVLGLSIGMAACLLILQYVRYEWRYDKISPNTPLVWRAFNETLTEGRVVTQDGNTHSALGPSLKADLPEISDFFRLYNGNQNEAVVLHEGVPRNIPHVWLTDPGFLRLFPQEFLEGNAADCLSEPWKMVITQSMAASLFPGQPALGKPLRIAGGPLAGDYLVEGVVADPPQNTHLKFNFLSGYATRYAKGHEDNWSGYWDYTYFALSPGADPEKVQKQLDAYSQQHLQRESLHLSMQPFESIHLYSDLTYEIEPNVKARTVNLIALMGLFILGIAFINYINMTTSRALERAGEVGLRKVIGAGRRQLLQQFMLEGLLLNGFALVLCLILTAQLMPWMEQWTGRSFFTRQSLDLGFGLSVLGILGAGMVAACGYPAWMLTRFAPAQFLKGKYRNSGEGSRLRKALVVFQFGCAAALVFALLVVGRQLQFLQQQDKGMQLDQLLAVKTPSVDWDQDSIFRRSAAVFKNEAARLPLVQSVTASNVAPSLGITTISGTSSGLVLAERPNDIRQGTTYFIDAQPDFYETYGIRFLAGQPYPAPDNRSGNNHVIINEAAMGMLGLPSPEAAIGQEIAYASNTNGHRMRIEGVVANFHIESLKEAPRPTLYFCTPEVFNGYFTLKIQGKDASQALTALESVWKSTYPEAPFQYWFLNEQFARQYAEERLLSRIFAVLAALAIFIACLGLFGLSAYAATLRTKEIGIRKVLGAGMAEIMLLLNKDFLKPVLLGVALAAFPAWYVLSGWLDDFAYRIQLPVWLYLLAGAIALVIAFLTVSIQSLRAATADPVKSLHAD